MRILILSEGGKKTGYGHLSRCKALYEAFCEATPYRPKFIINADATVAGLLKNINYTKADWFKDRNQVFDLVASDSIVIIDSYLADVKFYEGISALAKKAVYFDDVKRLEYPRGIVVNGAIYAERIGYPNRDGVDYLLGIQHFPIRREFWEVPVKRIKKTIDSVMVVFGGNDLRNMTPQVLKLLAAQYPQIKKNVIIGKAFDNVARIRKEADKNTQLFLYPDAAKMKKVMLNSDIAISAGGQTLYELARTGVPTIALTVIDNQANNMRGWKTAGFIKDIGWWNDDNMLGNLSAALKTLSSRDERVKYSHIGSTLIDGKGAHRIVETLLS